MDPVDAAERGRTLESALEIQDLPASGLRFSEALAAEFLTRLLGPAAKRGPVRFAAAGDGHAEIDVTSLSPEEPPPVRIRGRLRASFDTTCVRCLEDVRLGLDVPIESSLFPDADSTPNSAPPGSGGTKARSPKPARPETGELVAWNDSFPDPEKLDDGSYDGLRIPLPEILAQALLIELPVDPACADEPSCDERTRALIEQANAAAEAADAEGDPRWAALRALRAAASDDASGEDPTGNR